MKHLFNFLILCILTSCIDESFKYKVYGSVKTNKGERNAIWYSDTIYFNLDTAYYINSDSSIVKIYPPYKITEIK